MSSGRRLTGLISDAGVGEKRPIDDVGEAPLQGADGLGRGVAVLAPTGQEHWASGWWRAWVMAMRCNARLSCRLPVRLRRWRCLLPDHTGSGAVPLWQA
jgi:hypothetical protein